VVSKQGKKRRKMERGRKYRVTKDLAQVQKKKGKETKSVARGTGTTRVVGVAQVSG